MPGLCSFGKIQRFTQLVIQHRGDVFAASNDNVENDNYAVAKPFLANQENVKGSAGVIWAAAKTTRTEIPILICQYFRGLTFVAQPN